jgi:Tetratricopeptide repeat
MIAGMYVKPMKELEAEEMNRRSLAGREKVLGVDHPDTPTTINNLGLLYRDLGKLAEAERTFLRVLAGKKQV